MFVLAEELWYYGGLKIRQVEVEVVFAVFRDGTIDYISLGWQLFCEVPVLRGDVDRTKRGLLRHYTVLEMAP